MRVDFFPFNETILIKLIGLGFRSVYTVFVPNVWNGIVTTFVLDGRVFVRHRGLTTGGPIRSEHNCEISMFVYRHFSFEAYRRVCVLLHYIMAGFISKYFVMLCSLILYFSEFNNSF